MGFAAVTAVLTLFAACYAHSERDAVASYYDVSSSLIPVDPYGAIIPAILALAIGVGLYGVAVLLAIGFSVVKHLSKGKPGKGGGRVARWGDWLFATRVNKAPVPKIAKLASVWKRNGTDAVDRSGRRAAGIGDGHMGRSWKWCGDDADVVSHRSLAGGRDRSLATSSHLRSSRR
jgi:hypothetical protein